MPAPLRRGPATPPAPVGRHPGEGHGGAHRRRAHGPVSGREPRSRGSGDQRRRRPLPPRLRIPGNAGRAGPGSLDGRARWQLCPPGGHHRAALDRGQRDLAGGAAADRRGYSDPRWGTAEEIAQAGARVRAGERETTALHWRFGGTDPRTGDRWETRVFRNPVYNAEQCEGLPCLDHDGTVWSHHPPVGKILAVPGIAVSASGSARYDLGRDRIELPDPERFASRQAYYRTAIHEVGHWTGHPSRLNRPTLAGGLAEGLGSREYAREELRAEIHSYLTGVPAGPGPRPLPARRLHRRVGQGAPGGSPRDLPGRLWRRADLALRHREDAGNGASQAGVLARPGRRADPSGSGARGGPGPLIC